MRIHQIRTLDGPNVHLHRPVLVMQLELQDLTERESYEIPGFIDRLIERLPGLTGHGCDTGQPGRFVERLRLGTYFGHVVEHVAIELMNLAGYPAAFGRTRSAGPPGLYNVVVEFHAELAARYLLESAVQLVEAVVREETFALDGCLAEASRIAAATELGPSTRAIVDAASQRSIPWRRLNDESLVQLGYGINRRLIQAATGDTTRAVAVEIVGDKELTRRLLREAFIPVPRGYQVNSASEAVAALEELGGPVVVKPVDGRQGLGVSLNLSVGEEVERAFEIAREFGSAVLVEQFLAGRDYRLLVIGGRVVAASERIPAHVVGDGTHTVAELVAMANLDPNRGEGHEKPLTRMRIDQIALGSLGRQNLTPGTVPPAGQTVWLRASANLSTGGTAIDVTDQVHPATLHLCVRAARLLGLDICGIDLIAPDISQPVEEGRGGIVELNASPGLRMHLFPSAGRRREVGQAVVNMLYPPGTPARIPVVSITGTNGKTTTARMVAHALASSGKTVGLTTTDGIWIGGECVAAGDMTGPRSARMVLGDPIVEAAVLETARGGIVRGGLGYDWADVGIITNIQRDHIGQDGIRTIEDLVHIKSLVAERVRRGGALVLNADDPRSSAIAQLPRVEKLSHRVIYFSLHADHPTVERHRALGGTAFVVRDGWVVEARGTVERPVVAISAIPATLMGAAEYQVANAMAAIAAARALGLSKSSIARAMETFQGSPEDNPGRTNLYRAGAGYVLLDYGHNPHAFEAVGSLVATHRSQGYRATGIVGVPGDRADEVIEEAGRVAATLFDQVIVREDNDCRGRQAGETMGLLCQGLATANATLPCRRVPDQVEALAAALAGMKPGELVVLFYEEFAPVRKLLERYRAVPVAALPGAPGMSLPAYSVSVSERS